MDRRRFLFRSVASMIVPPFVSEGPAMKSLDLIEANSNLGLRPRDDGSLPGTWRAATVLRDHGLTRALSFRRTEIVQRFPYHLEAQPGTRIRNGQILRNFSL